MERRKRVLRPTEIILDRDVTLVQVLSRDGSYYCGCKKVLIESVFGTHNHSVFCDDDGREIRPSEVIRTVLGKIYEENEADVRKANGFIPMVCKTQHSAGILEANDFVTERQRYDARITLIKYFPFPESK